MVESDLQEIRDFARASVLSPRQLARLAGLHENSLRDMFSEDWNPTAATIKAIQTIIQEKIDG